MPKIVLPIALLIAAGSLVFTTFRTFPERVSAATAQAPPEHLAEMLQLKIDTIREKHAQQQANPQENTSNRRSDRMEVSEAELESYFFHVPRENIPVELEAVRVELGADRVASGAQATFPSANTGNLIVDRLLGGTHNLFVKGKLTGAEGRGQFDLEEVHVDGIPIPNVLAETLFDQYVKPSHPEADLRESFELPWGIQQLTIVPGKATIVY